ncbi:MAG: phosphoserine phosphatase SerB [Lentisphaeraceae bacterium]|nr:phosphoserine phosphatase SerB [Lentisphaeraceae bacterium]
MTTQLIHLAHSHNLCNSTILRTFESANIDVQNLDLRGDSENSLLTVTINGDATPLKGEFEKLGYTCTIEDSSAHSGETTFAITIMGRKISTPQLGTALFEIESQKLDVFQIRRLSLESDTSKACYEIIINTKKSLEDLRDIFNELAESIKLDICVNTDNFARKNIRMAVFDMDSTLIQCECIDELAKHCGIGEQVASITASAMRGEIDFIESFSKRMALLNGLSEDVLQKIADNLPLTEGVPYLMKSLKKLGIKIVLLSGGFNFFANHLKNMLGIDYAYANELEIVDGAVTGRVTGEVVDGKRKKEYLIEIAKKENICLSQVAAIGDGANDLPMIKTSGLGVAFHAKPLVREEAGMAVSSIGLDGLLYLFGKSDEELQTS